jgi:GT2 family glycosyltransferase
LKKRTKKLLFLAQANSFLRRNKTYAVGWAALQPTTFASRPTATTFASRPTETTFAEHPNQFSVWKTLPYDLLGIHRMSDQVSEILQEETSPATSARRRTPAFETDTRPRETRKADRAGAALESAPRNRLLPLIPDGSSRPTEMRQAVEVVAAARGGGIMIIGWIADMEWPLDCVAITAPSWQLVFDAAHLIRIRRTDVEAALGATTPYLYGFFGLVAAPALTSVPASVQVRITLKNGGYALSTLATRAMGAESLRDLALGYLAGATYLGNPQAEAMAALDRGFGAEAIALNKSITSQITGARHVERFGVPRRQPVGSIIVCLYGKAEFLFVQNALFAGRPGIEDYEFIYVCNSPELTDTLLAEARAAQQIYGLNQSVVLLPGNAGFGAANNAGAAVATGRHILNVNPDIFPYQLDWAARHTELVTTLPPEQTRLFGPPLYYDDGALMHGGMYFEIDSAVIARDSGVERRRMARVEHYGKGAPPGAGTYTRPRPVPAVSGAFISSHRDWYRSLGGFTEDYIFGHYEDADLCMKSLAAGTPAWLHDLRMWHLEGKGSTRHPHHEGGALVNRWLFTRNWADTIANGLTGPVQTHRLMSPSPPPEIAVLNGKTPRRRAGGKARH